MTTIRTLIDTNVIIALEDDHILKKEFADFHREAVKIGNLLIHPISKVDISRDKNLERRKRTLSKLGKYEELEKPPEPDSIFLSKLKALDNPRERVDATILYSVVKNAVDFFVTEDQGIHRKAFILGIQERVLTIKQGVVFFRRLLHRDVPTHILVKNIPVYNLQLNDRFFDSLRADYGEKEFNLWFENICREGRPCWAFIGDSSLFALCIYKEEKIADSKKIITPTLKLCTFKVSEAFAGKKIGELMLKLAFQYADRNKLSSVYLTVFPKYQQFIAFLEDFGFSYVGKKGEEFILMKKMLPKADEQNNYDALEYAVKYYPNFLDDPQKRKFIVPIQPQFHDRLFPDCPGTQKRIEDFVEPCPEGNTIKKAYICNAKTKQINKGDLLLFYRSRDWRAVTSIGVVEQAKHSDVASEIATFVSNRTVYTYEEIQQLASRTALVIIFRHMGNLNRPVNAFTLAERCGVQGPIQSIRRIPYDIFKKIMEMGK